MKSLRNLVVLVVLAIVALGAMGSPAGASGKQFKKTVFFDMYYEGQVKPNRIFTTANSGPYFKKLKWKDWGENRAVARGRFISDCASCGEKENKPARVYMRKLIPCPDQKVMTYEHVRLKVLDPQDPNRTLDWHFGCPPPGSDRVLRR
jgi:hypothetical protein